MAGPEDRDQVRDKADTDKAKDYFSKLPGFEAPNFEKPAPVEEQPASDEWVPPTKASKPEAPLSEAEEYFKKIIPK